MIDCPDGVCLASGMHRVCDRDASQPASQCSIDGLSWCVAGAARVWKKLLSGREESGEQFPRDSHVWRMEMINTPVLQ